MSWLTWLSTLNLIDVLNVYLIAAFVASTVIRLRSYRAILGLIFSFPNRWPRLLELVKRYRTIFLRWPTVLPITLTSMLMLANTMALHLVWVQAEVTAADLRAHSLALLAVLLTGATMLVLDWKALFTVGRFNRTALEVDLDKAEHWLQSWQAPAVRVLTFGFINPRKIVNDKIRDALLQASLLVNGQLWVWSLQIAMRLSFGLALWMTWAWALHGLA